MKTIILYNPVPPVKDPESSENSDSSDGSSVESEVKPVAKVKYYKKYLNKDASQKLFDELKSTIPWTVGVYNMFGKKVNTPRLLYAMKDPQSDITKSYKVTDAADWTPLSLKLKKMIEKTIKKKITYAQLNYYRNGDDYIGYHTDFEVGEGDVVASISLGAERDFIFRNIEDERLKHKMTLGNGSLLVMDEFAAKKNWKHSLPKMKNSGERINITFRIR